jgi:hypothetical protein
MSAIASPCIPEPLEPGRVDMYAITGQLAKPAHDIEQASMTPLDGHSIQHPSHHVDNPNPLSTPLLAHHRLLMHIHKTLQDTID